jgi:hypothetical protein
VSVGPVVGTVFVRPVVGIVSAFHFRSAPLAGGHGGSRKVPWYTAEFIGQKEPNCALDCVRLTSFVGLTSARENAFDFDLI